ncbi:MAG: RusA family crossover junction endodeoxyribonuclease [Halanaerobiales bacterium]
MERFKITIPGEMPGLNKITKAAKDHYHAYNNMKRENTELVMLIANKLPKMKSVKLNITWYCKNKRRDPDNIAAAKKFILDGLVEAGVLKNDGWSEVKGWEESWEVDKDNPRVEVTLEGELAKEKMKLM